MIRRLGGPLLCAAVLAWGGPAGADVPPAQRPEVEHLIAFVRGSGCVMERNGRRYTADDAARHIRRKYEHFRDEIHDSGDFIRLAATRSSVTGRPYRVICGGGEPQPAGAWLRRELQRYRSGHAAGS